MKKAPDGALQLIGHTEAVLSLAIDSKGRRGASGALDRSVRLWDLETPAAVWAVGPGDEAVTVLAFSADGALLAAGDRAYQVRVFKGDGTLVRAIAHPDPVAGLAFSPDGKWLAVAGAGGNAEVYPLNEGKSVCELRGRTVDFTDDGKLIVSAVKSGELVVTELKGCKQKRVTSTAPHLPFSAASGSAALVGTRNGAEPFVLLWNALEGRMLGKLEKQTGGVTALSLSRDGRRALVSSDDDHVRLYDVEKREVLKTFDTRALPFAAMSADGSRALISDGLGVQAVSLTANP